MSGSAIRVVNFEGAAVLVRAGRCTVTGMKFINEDSAVRFCQIFDASSAASVTVGTTEPYYVLVAGANGGDDAYSGGLNFDNGIVVAGTTTPDGSVAAADNTQHFWAIIG